MAEVSPVIEMKVYFTGGQDTHTHTHTHSISFTQLMSIDTVHCNSQRVLHRVSSSQPLIVQQDEAVLISYHCEDECFLKPPYLSYFCQHPRHDSLSVRVCVWVCACSASLSLSLSLSLSIASSPPSISITPCLSFCIPRAFSQSLTRGSHLFGYSLDRKRRH